MVWMILGSFAAGLGGLGMYLYYLGNGQFDEDEDVKYQIFREDNPDQ